MHVYDLVESAVLYRSRRVMRLGWILISLAVATVRLSVIVFAIHRECSSVGAARFDPLSCV
jgi:hypothetical protein